MTAFELLYRHRMPSVAAISFPDAGVRFRVGLNAFAERPVHFSLPDDGSMRYAEGAMAGAAMGQEDGDSYELLREYRLGRQGLTIKLDRGFEPGTYCIYVEFDELAARVGFAAAHRRAADYCALLKTQLDDSPLHALGETEDASLGVDPPRKRDLELTYLCFTAKTGDELYDDDAMKEEFGLALLRTSQQWDQRHAHDDTRRQGSRRDAFRSRLHALLDGDPYRHLNPATKNRLLEDVPPLVFPPRGFQR